MSETLEKQTAGGDSLQPVGSAKEPLIAEVVGGRLVASIGIETLVWASAAKNGGPLEDCEVDGRRRREWAEDVVREMTRENEIGESPLGKFLDEMMDKAANNGSGALCWSNH
jgi:hypothetical protein